MKLQQLLFLFTIATCWILAISALPSPARNHLNLRIDTTLAQQSSNNQNPPVQQPDQPSTSQSNANANVNADQQSSSLNQSPCRASPCPPSPSMSVATGEALNFGPPSPMVTPGAAPLTPISPGTHHGQYSQGPSDPAPPTPEFIPGTPGSGDGSPQGSPKSLKKGAAPGHKNAQGAKIPVGGKPTRVPAKAKLLGRVQRLAHAQQPKKKGRTPASVKKAQAKGKPAQKKASTRKACGCWPASSKAEDGQRAERLRCERETCSRSCQEGDYTTEGSSNEDSGSRHSETSRSEWESRPNSGVPKSRQAPGPIRATAMGKKWLVTLLSRVKDV
ncbi:hypothetical protein DFP72DRAFT_1046499 [Ephemerocybe angulata]|uniref:Uncharacterized protein n=1 Tax=Ephemerocybe angulata TaxID=980116 RepID=A0A8H6M740_9AGAR|nr:hypothetical protein DFP72DRAFT_1046499 [Tulosesus angulatus]